MHLDFWTILMAMFLTNSSGTPLQIENTLVPSTRPNITTIAANEINPYHYNVAGTDIWLKVLLPYGAFLPTTATLVCLTNVRAEFAEVIVDVGDRPLRGSYTKLDHNIRISIQVISTTGFAVSTVESALRGIYELMTGNGGPGIRAIAVIVNDEAHGIIGRIAVSSAGSPPGTATMLNKAPATTIEAASATSGPGIAENEAILAARATTSMTASVANLTSANTIGPLTPDHYLVPGTSVYVAVLRPYGHELPHDLTINLLLDAAFSLSNTRMAGGDVFLPMEWSYGARGLFIGFNSRSFNRPHLTIMQAGIVGLIDLMGEEAVVGTKEISFSVGVESQGGMGIGWVKWEVHPVNGGNATWQEAATTVASLAPSNLLSMGGVETGLVGTS